MSARKNVSKLLFCNERGYVGGCCTKVTNRSHMPCRRFNRNVCRYAVGSFVAPRLRGVRSASGMSAIPSSHDRWRHTARARTGFQWSFWFRRQNRQPNIQGCRGSWPVPADPASEIDGLWASVCAQPRQPVRRSNINPTRWPPGVRAQASEVLSGLSRK